MLSTLYPPFDVGGAEKSTALIARGLAKRGHNVIVLTLQKANAQGNSVVDGVRVAYRPLRNLYWPYGTQQRHGTAAKLAFHAIDTLNVAMAATVGDVVRAERPDIALSNAISGFSSLAWRSIKNAGVPILHTPRDFYLLCPKTMMFSDGKPCQTLCTGCRELSYPRRIMSRYVDAVTGISTAILDRHRAFGMFPNAKFLKPIVNATGTPALLPERPPIVPGAPVRFGYVGRLAPEKGLDVLLDGFAQIDPARWSLSLAGRAEPDYLAHLKHRCANLPVHFLGFVPVDEFYRTVDVVAAPSIWEEPGPRTVLEALGHGLAVIVSTRCGHVELLDHGRTAYVFDPDIPGQLTTAIKRIIANPSEAHMVGVAGRDIVTARTEDAVAADYEVASQDTIGRYAKR